MYKITKVSLTNYRAFYDKTIIEINNGQNVFLYGENGSGKSSIYKALQDFFNAADPVYQSDNMRHLHIADTDPFEVEIQFTDSQNRTVQSISFTGNDIDFAASLPEVAQTYQLNSFLSYKEMLRTQLIDKQQFASSFFDLMINTLLKNYAYQSTNITQELAILQDNTLNNNDATDRCNGLQAFLNNKFRLLGTECQLILNEFKQGINIVFEENNTQLSLVSNKVIGETQFNINYIGKNNVDHLDILNEARLSALAISIYLAALKTNPTQNTYKILFLDDIFIGLDTSNRLPLLKILDEHFSDFQIFLTTYDRHWFEVAKQNLTSGWLSKEMYVGTTEDLLQNFDYPLIQSSKDHYTNAEVYANRKKKEDGSDNEIDYPAAGNYLRKACEETLKDLLYGKYKFFLNKDQETRLCEQLRDLWQSFKWLMRDIDINISALFSDFDYLSKVVFNSLSHDNLHKPIYKTDIKKGFTFIDELRKIKKELPINIIRLQYNNPNGIHNYELTIKGELYVYKYGTSRGALSPCKFTKKMFYTAPNAQPTEISTQDYTSIADAYKKIAEYAGQEGHDVNVVPYLDAMHARQQVQDVNVILLNAVSYKDASGNWQPIVSLL